MKNEESCWGHQKTLFATVSGAKLLIIFSEVRKERGGQEGGAARRIQGVHRGSLTTLGRETDLLEQGSWGMQGRAKRLRTTRRGVWGRSWKKAGLTFPFQRCNSGELGIAEKGALRGRGVSYHC